jgi:6-oxo-cyclohex-1-ene-carbonyl-CoA hydrolase
MRDKTMTNFEFASHDLVADSIREGITDKVLFEKRPAKLPDGTVVEGLYNVWIILNNPGQYNSYTTDMVKAVILGFRAASNMRDVNAVIFTAVGDKAFCTGGNTKEYAEYYSGRPEEYRQYMRLFNDMVSAILGCDKPVVCRVNGMRIAGGQEIGMACDFTISSDLARFGQAGPKHGSAAIGGSTDFLPLMIGAEMAFVSGMLCETFTAHEAMRLGMITDIAPVLKVDGKYIANPMVETRMVTDEWGRIVHGKPKTGEALAEAKAVMAKTETDLSELDRKVEELCGKLLLTFPGCTTKSVEELRKPKLNAWNMNKENSRAWLGLNMLAEANMGFRAFNEGNREVGREIDFVQLRRELAEGTKFTPDYIDSMMPGVRK